MKRHYNNVENDDEVVYFVGPEVENTKMVGQPTLFKVGDRPLDEILEYVKIAMDKTDQPIEHIYFTANRSMRDIQDWSVCQKLLEMGYMVTVDGKAHEYTDLLGIVEIDHPNLIKIFSLEIQKADELIGGNAYVKIDDVDFNYSNSGVWVGPANHIANPNNHTDWSQYRQDAILARYNEL